MTESERPVGRLRGCVDRRALGRPTRTGANMFDSAIIDVAIGITLLFAILSTLTSAIVEAISRFLGLRGAFLLTGLRSLVDGTPGPPADGSQQKPAVKTPRMPRGTKPAPRRDR